MNNRKNYIRILTKLQMFSQKPTEQKIFSDEIAIHHRELINYYQITTSDTLIIWTVSTWDEIYRCETHYSFKQTVCWNYEKMEILFQDFLIINCIYQTILNIIF